MDLLENLFNHVIIPDKVFSEVVVRRKELGYGDVYLVETFIEKGVIVVRETWNKEQKDMPIGKGEMEAFMLAVNSQPACPHHLLLMCYHIVYRLSEAMALPSWQFIIFHRSLRSL